MRVLHVIPAVADRYGGPSATVLAMTHELRARGVDARIATTDADGPGRLGVAHRRMIDYRGVPAVFFRRRLGESLKYSGSLARWLHERVAEYDVVHVHGVFSHPCLAAARACRAQDRPYVVRPLGTLDPWSLRQNALRKRLFLRLGGERMLRDAAAIHYTTEAERLLVEQRFRLERGVVIPLAVPDTLIARRDTAFRRPHFASDPDTRYVLFLGRLHPKKRPDLLIDAFAHVAGRDRGATRLVFAGVGENGYIEHLRARAHALDIGSAVHFAGWVSGTEKSAVLAHADLFALLSEQENFGLAVAEAMNFKVPVLISDRVNLADHVKRAGAGWVVPLDVDAVAEALAEILADRAERNRRGNAGPALVDRAFRWTGIARDLISLYERLSKPGMPTIRTEESQP